MFSPSTISCLKYVFLNIKPGPDFFADLPAPRPPPAVDPPSYSGIHNWMETADYPELERCRVKVFTGTDDEQPSGPSSRMASFLAKHGQFLQEPTQQACEDAADPTLERDKSIIIISRKPSAAVLRSTSSTQPSSSASAEDPAPQQAEEEQLRFALHPIAIKEWKLNRGSRKWERFVIDYYWSANEDIFNLNKTRDTPFGKCLFDHLNPLRLMVALAYQSRWWTWDNMEDWLVVPSEYFYELQASGKGRDPAVQKEIEQGWLPSGDEMYAAVCGNLTVDYIVEDHVKTSPLDRHRQIQLQEQLQLLRDIALGPGGEEMLQQCLREQAAPFTEPSVIVKPRRSLWQKLRKRFWVCFAGERKKRAHRLDPYYYN